MQPARDDDVRANARRFNLRERPNDHLSEGELRRGFRVRERLRNEVDGKRWPPTKGLATFNEELPRVALVGHEVDDIEALTNIGNADG